MPRPGDIAVKSHEFLDLPSLPWLREAVGEGFVRGGVYLLAGEPGIGKTTLALQVLGDVALQGIKVLYVTTEQGLADIKRGLKRIHGSRSGSLPAAIQQHFFLDDSVDDIDSLPKFLARRVLTDGQDYHGTQVIVVDSVQGRGLSAAATQKYRALMNSRKTPKRRVLLRS
jgi:DNA repair protein RadA/Sms